MENTLTCFEPCRGDRPNRLELSAEDTDSVERVRTKNRQNHFCLQRVWLLIKDSRNITKGNVFLTF